ncbi:MAG TPA: cobalt-precorrin-5B (C(1))-methyltransferase CbiD [Candidatus Obscuribacterales bacterium]
MPSDTSPPRSGYTLPVFACASAIAALQKLLDAASTPQSVTVNLIHPEEQADIPIEQVATLPDGAALAITRSDPGDNLDLTRHTPIWAMVAWGATDQPTPIHLTGGEGVGRQVNAADQPAIYAYARRLLIANLQPLLPAAKTIEVTIILPEGRSLARRTSNAAFGVVDGLSLLGTSGLAAPLSAPGQLDAFRQTVREKAAQFTTLVFCVGENGLDKALTLGITPEQRIKTGNWLGPLLLEAAVQGVANILLVGYHGKLIKLAGGIFHTHHYVADGRQEILTAIAAIHHLPAADLQTLYHCETLEAGLTHLRQLDAQHQTAWVEQVYRTIVERLDERAIAYVQANVDRPITIGSALFDRQREMIATSDRGQALLQTLLVS